MIEKMANIKHRKKGCAIAGKKLKKGKAIIVECVAQL